MSLATVLAVEARFGKELDADGVADLELPTLELRGVFCEDTSQQNARVRSPKRGRTGDGDDTTGSLMSSDERELGSNRPVSLENI